MLCRFFFIDVQFDGFSREMGLLSLLVCKKGVEKICDFEQCWRICKVYQSFVRLLLFDGGFALVRESSAVGGFTERSRQDRPLALASGSP